MNDDNHLERLYGNALHSVAPTRAPDRLRTRIKSETGGVAPRPRWLALIKEPPMRTNSHLAVGSPTWRAATVMAGALLLAALVVGASFAGSQISATTDYIVDASGDGTHTTIAAAVADAEDGYEILVRPGIYAESFELDKTVTIRGDGPVEDIIVSALEGGPTVEIPSGNVADPYAIHITGGEPTIADMTFRGRPSELIVSGGSPTIEGIVMDDVGWTFDGVDLTFGGSSIVVMGSKTNATIRDNELREGGPIALFGDAVAEIDGNTLSGGPHLFLRENGPGTVVTDNHVSGAVKYALNIHDTTGTEITGNTFTDSGDVAIRVRNGGDGVINGNVVAGGSHFGIHILGADGLDVINNNVAEAEIGILWNTGDGRIKANDVRDSSTGIVIGGGSPIVEHNASCDNASVNFAVSEPATPDVRNNEFCPEPPAG